MVVKETIVPAALFLTVLQNLDWILLLLPEDCQVKMEEERNREENEKENAW